MTTGPTAAHNNGLPHGDRAWITGREFLVVFAFWTFMAALTAANALLDPRGRGLQPVLPSSPIALAFAESYMWALVTPVVFWLSRRYALERSNWMPRIMLFFGIGLVVAIVIQSLAAYLRIRVFFTPRFPPPSQPLFLVSIQRLWWLDDLVIFIAILAAGFARDYFLRYNARVEEAVRLQAHAAHLQAQLAEVRLATLRNQLDPHFLFNTLNAVSSLVDRDPRGARRMITRLSELLRHTLEGADEQEVPLEEELGVLDRYLEIMRIRFQGNLETTTEVGPGLRDALVPNLILQPLVENSIKHGISLLGAGGRVVVSAHRDGDRVVLRVQDNGAPAAAIEAELSEGVGLRNTRARLLQLYGEDQSFSLIRVAGGGMIAEVVLPYHTRADLHTALIPVA